MYCGGGLAEGNCQCGVACGGVFIPDRGGGVNADRCRSQLIGLNLLISIITWV